MKETSENRESRVPSATSATVETPLVPSTTVPISISRIVYTTHDGTSTIHYFGKKADRSRKFVPWLLRSNSEYGFQYSLAI